MSYLVLARKWRPRNFETLVGQEHVVRALRHALDEQRLHHAWLFTGTRGVGKTTLSRILAKSLNCIGPDGTGGITSKPCGACRPCVDIDAGRFVDYIEIDAASNRGVDEMAALLEQAVYSPANARFKVYMIDEVHMLTSHAFNAMLKTLEEPPEHVKFILATTDPQKIPVTVLSRCLQFNLKQMPIDDIATHLAQVLGAEGVPSDKGALMLLGRAASGSMRDALSLTDQAIAYGGGRVEEATVRAMLGALDQTYLHRILDALAERDGATLVGIVDEIAARSLSFGQALQDLGAILHRIALVQTIDTPAEEGDTEAAHVRELATRLSPEEVQLYYQIAAYGRRDLPLAPDETTGFSMALLRMLAFGIDAAAPTSTAGRPAPVPRPAPVTQTGRASAPIPPQRVVAREPIVERNMPSTEESAPAPSHASSTSRPAVVASASSSTASSAVQKQTPSPVVTGTTPTGDPFVIDDWVGTCDQLHLTGLAQQLVQHSELVTYDANSITIRVPIKSVFSGPAQLDKLKAALSKHYGRRIDVRVEHGAVTGTTVASTRRVEQAAKQADAQAIIDADPFVQAVVRDFGATIVPGSIKPV
jgi:DNA polymerase-3 subunit gamma/tau